MQSRDRFGNIITLTRKTVTYEGTLVRQKDNSTSNAPLVPATTAIGDSQGLYQGTFTVYKGGLWLLHLRLRDGTPSGSIAPAIDGSPFSVMVASAPISPAHSSAVGTGKYVFNAGSKGWLQITTRDIYGNVVDYSQATPEQYMVTISPRVSSVTDTPITSRRNGSYDMTWSATHAQNFSVAVSLTKVRPHDILHIKHEIIRNDKEFAYKALNNKEYCGICI